MAVFQPHGYGPFGFMESTLFDYLEADLQSGDLFILLEPFYAGGTSSFSPHSVDVACAWQKKSRHPETYVFAPDRESAAQLIQENCRRGDVIAVMGARDNSLGDFARRLAGK